MIEKEFYASLGIKRKRASIEQTVEATARKIPRNASMPKIRFTLRPLLTCETAHVTKRKTTFVFMFVVVCLSRYDQLSALDVPNLISQSDLKVSRCFITNVALEISPG